MDRYDWIDNGDIEQWSIIFLKFSEFFFVQRYDSKRDRCVEQSSGGMGA